MRSYRVIRIYNVSAESKKEALEKVRGDRWMRYLSVEFAEEVEDGGWIGTLKRRLVGGRR